MAKERLGPVLADATPVTLNTDWRAAPLIKARLSGGYCVRTLAQGVCAYTNICEHCPNFRSDTTFLPVLLTQRTDAAALAADAPRPEAGAKKRPGTADSSNDSTSSSPPPSRRQRQSGARHPGRTSLRPDHRRRHPVHLR